MLDSPTHSPIKNQHTFLNFPHDSGPLQWTRGNYAPKRSVVAGPGPKTLSQTDSHTYSRRRRAWFMCDVTQLCIYRTCIGYVTLTSLQHKTRRDSFMYMCIYTRDVNHLYTHSLLAISSI